jgi:hypothetical protein
VGAPACALCLLLAGCIVVQDSPAPGCRRVIGLPSTGGCFGKAAIVDLQVDPPVDCLTVSANNCNGGVLSIANACSEPLSLGGVEIAPAQRVTVDVAEGDGQYALTPSQGNFSAFLPARDEAIEITGDLSEMEVHVSFTKTGPLCH